MIKLQKISLVAGIILLVYLVVERVIGFDYSLTSVLIINYFMTYFVRGAAAIFAGIVAHNYGCRVFVDCNILAYVSISLSSEFQNSSTKV